MNNWKTMVYGYDLPTTILADGAFQGDKGIYEWFVVSYGSHPCAYVTVPSDSKFYRKDEYEMPKINCHGGVNFATYKFPKSAEDIVNHVNGWIIGWDYMHDTDFRISPLYIHDGRIWTTEEMVAECENVIDQILKIDNGD